MLPAKPTYDIFYALEYAVPFRDDRTTLEWHHFSEVPDRKKRVKIFLDAYGTELADVADEVANVQRMGIGHIEYLAGRGLYPQKEWLEDGTIETVEKRAAWTVNHKEFFE